MIVTVTMNPAIDKTLDTDQLEYGTLNRIHHVEVDAGGKGINVSKTIHYLGGESIATGFIAGNTGNTLKHIIEEWGIKSDFVEVSGETRTNTKVYEKTGEVTELNEPGPEVGEDDVKVLMEKLEGYAKEDTLFVIAGSVPKGVDKTIYKQVIELVHKKGAKVLLDADGELFANAVEAAPNLVKPNRAELEQYAGINYIASEQEIMDVAKRLEKKGIDKVVVSMGKMGAMFLWDSQWIRCQGLSVKAHSTVGAGDAMVAALSYAWDKKLPMDETIRLCIAVSAGAVMTIGTKPPKKDVVEDLMKQVVFERI